MGYCSYSGFKVRRRGVEMICLDKNASSASYKVIITSAVARVVECEGASYKFNISLIKGRNEIEFETVSHYHRFCKAVESEVRRGKISIGGARETQETKPKSRKKSKRKAKN